MHILIVFSQTSSYCGQDAQLRLAEPSDLSLVCGEWSVGEEPELYSQEVEVVLPIQKIINHPSYSTAGPGEGYDIAVFHVDDTKLRVDGVVREGYIYPACLPTDQDISTGKKGIFASWKDPTPLYVYYCLDFNRTVQRYRNDELVLRHTRMDIVECKDPAWMASNTFYPRGVLCGRDPSCESCLDTGDSGSGLVTQRVDGESYAWAGPLSFYRGCDREGAQDTQIRLSVFNGENPGIFTNGGCYLEWIARQYGMVGDNTSSDCDKTSGDMTDSNKTDCVTYKGRKCDFASQFSTESFYTNVGLQLNKDPRDLVFNKCVLRTVEGYTNMVFQCPIDQDTLGVCPNNCVGVDPSAIVAGGTALVAAATLTTLNIIPILGISGLALIGGSTVAMMMTCQGPFYCRVGDGCCLVLLDPVFGIVCPSDC